MQEDGQSSNFEEQLTADIKNTISQKITSMLKEPKLTEDDLYGGIYLFYSFDLVNSTIFKTSHAEEWPSVFKYFYDLIEKELESAHSGVRVWKYIGDEVLFYKRITRLEELHSAPSKVWNVIKTVTNNLYKEHERTRMVLFIKSTMWIANVRYGGDLYSKSEKIEGNDASNIIFPVSVEEGSQVGVYDFLGPDIDLGFRLSKFTGKSKVLLSAELAYLLYRQRGEVENDSNPNYRVEDNLRIVSYEKLKGIMNERRYPIVWYHETWNERSFDYDEHFESDIVQKLLNGKFHPIDKIDKIFVDLNLKSKIEKYLKIVPKSKEGKGDIPFVPQARQSEVHCAAICFSSEGKLMIAKRPSHKRRLAGLWQFGCGQLSLNQSFQDCLIKSYMHDFGIKLNLLGDDPIPVATYTVQGEKNRKIPGILFLAVVDQVPANQSYLETKHDEVKWVEINYLDDKADEEFVPKFKESAKLAYELFQKHYLEN